MKTPSLVLLLLLVSLQLLAQKENNVWVGGDDVLIDFSSGVPIPLPRNDNQKVWRSNATICDSLGELLFYTNGYRIYNRNFQLMQNGNDLNIGDYESWGYNLLSVHDGAAIVPVPDNPDKYYVFHTDLNFCDFDTFPGSLMSTHIFYCLVDLSLNNGNGAVVADQKDIVILSDTLVQTGFKIVKHGNGRDYWLLCHEAGSSRFYRFRIDPYGVHGPYEQFIGGELNGYDAFNKNVLNFSEDGSKAAQFRTMAMAVDLYDFNRCSGEFYNLQTFTVDDSLFYLMDAEFSPSNRFIYVTANYWTNLFQFDLTAPNITASRQLISVYSGALNPFATRYDKLCLAPDRKIYVCTYDGCRSLHVINQPDSLGLECDFEENGLQIPHPPGNNWSSVPNTVNYSLGPAYGSGCDTVTKAHALPKPTFTFGVYPNPFSSELQLTITGVVTKANVVVSNVLGQTVYDREFSPDDFSIRSTVDLSAVAAGVYFVTVDVNGQRLTRKVVKR